MTPEQRLLAVPLERWSTRQAIVLDWYDGPREGLCALASPGGEFLFELLGERPNPDDLDDRLFLIREIPDGTVDALVADIQELGSPGGPVWVPVWRFRTESARERVEQRLRQIQTDARPISLVVSTRDLKRFLECWRAAPPPHAGLWSALSGIAPPVST